MRRGPVNIPYANFGRTVEYLEGGSGYEKIVKRGRVALVIHNAVSYVLRPYHFDSIGEFQGFQGKLAPQLSQVAFTSPLNVLERKWVKPGGERAICSIRLGDDSGVITLEYPYKIDTVEDDEMPPDVYNDPLHGAQPGDQLQVFSSTYTGEGVIEVVVNFQVRNDKLYERIREIRDSGN